LIQLLQSTLEVRLVSSSPFHRLVCEADFSTCRLTSFQHPEASVRQSAYALLGDMAISCEPLNQFLPLFLPRIVKEISDQVENPKQEEVSVCNNAAWAVGEIAMQCRPSACSSHSTLFWSLLQPSEGKLIDRFILFDLVQLRALPPLRKPSSLTSPSSPSASSGSCLIRVRPSRSSRTRPSPSVGLDSSTPRSSRAISTSSARRGAPSCGTSRTTTRRARPSSGSASSLCSTRTA
jgi:hypothetical protein